MLNLLNFFADEGNNSDWVMYVVIGVMVVGMIAWMIFSNRRQKQRAQDMMSKLSIGCTITTIGGIVGEVVELDQQNVWIVTGTNDTPTTMKLIRQAIYSIAPAPGTPEAAALEEAKKKSEDEVDEIK